MFHTNNVRVTNTVVSSEGERSGVIRGKFCNFALRMGVFVDRSLYGNGYRFSANFRIIRATDNRVFNDFWNGNLDSDLDFGSDSINISFGPVLRMLKRPAGCIYTALFSWSMQTLIMASCTKPRGFRNSGFLSKSIIFG